MDNNCEYKEVSVDYQEEIGATQQAVECAIDTSAKGGINKLLSVCADATVNMAEKMGAEIKVAGSINYKVICLNNDNMIESYDYVCDFTACVKGEYDDKYSSIFAKACALDIDSSIMGDIVKLQTICDIKVFALESKSQQVLVAVGEGIIADYKDIGLQVVVAKIDSNFIVTEEYESGVNVDKILLFDSDVISCNTISGEGSITIVGEVISTVMYESAGTINTKTFVVPYSEEISVKVDSYTKAELFTSVISSKIILAGMEDNNIIRVEVNCRARGVAYAVDEMTVIADVFSDCRELEVKFGDISYDKFIGEHCFKEKIAGSAELEEGMAKIRKILSACLSRNCITNAFAGDKVVTIEGIMACSVIYEDADSAIGSVQIELPYSIKFDCDKVMPEDILSTQAVVEILSAKVKRDSEIECSAMLTVQVKIKREIEYDVVEKVEVGCCRENDNKAITIYQTALGESLWNISKALGANKAEVLAQNPSLEQAGNGHKAVFYRQVTKN